MVYQNVTYKFVTDELICHLTSTPFPVSSIIQAKKLKYSTL